MKLARREAISLGSVIASAPLAPDGWRPALKAIKAHLGCTIIALAQVDQFSNRVSLHTDGDDPDAETLYRNSCAEAADTDPRARFAMTAPEMRVWTEWDLPIAQRAAARDLYETVFRPIGADFTRSIVLSRHAGETCVLATAQPAETAELGDRTNDALVVIGQAVGRALGLERRLQSEGLGRVVDVTQTLSAPAALLNAFGRVLHVTPNAAQVLSERAEVGIVGQHLAARSQETAELLRGAIARVTRSENPEPGVLRTPDGLTLTLVPLPPSHRVCLGEQAAAMVVFSFATTVDRLQALSERYRLTPAEREIAGLVAEGLSTDDIAERRQAARETIRSQVKAIYFKTASSNRAEFLAKYYQR